MHPFLSGLSTALPGGGFWEAPVVVAVSGGADSVALLVGLVRLAPSRARLIVAHACHDIRPDAAADRKFVESLAARLGLPFEAGELAVRDDPEGRGEGLEARARRLRYAFLTTVAHGRGARYVVVGHTADDQAETILHRILRGTGLTGLVGMRPSRALADGVGLLRPMLRLPRAMGREFLVTAEETWHEDPTNADVGHARNFLRHQILARAVRGPYPGAGEALTRLGEQAAAISAAFDGVAAHLLAVHSRRDGDGAVRLEAGPLAAYDRQIVRHMLVVLWDREGWPRRDMAARHYHAIEDLISRAGRGEAECGGAFDLPAGLRVHPTGRWVEVRRHSRVPTPVQ